MSIYGNWPNLAKFHRILYRHCHWLSGVLDAKDLGQPVGVRFQSHAIVYCTRLKVN